jgi:hypothetical protein
MTPPLSLLARLLSEPPDLTVVSDAESWEAVRMDAVRHGAAPLVAFIARPQMDSADRAWCDRILAESWTRHSRSLKQLDDVLSILCNAEIPSLSLKGPLLAQRYYQPGFLRKPSGDLDLAVRKADLDCAIKALARAGYVPEPRMREARAINHHLTLEHPSRPHIELHFNLSHKALGIPVDEFIDRSVTYLLPSGRPARILAPADEILHLVLHRAAGRFATLFHLYEIRKVWSSASVSIRQEAVRLAADRHFAGVFAMTDHAFRTRWGQPMLTPDLQLPRTWLNWRITEKLYNRFEQYSEPGRNLPLTVRLQRKWLDFQLTDQPADALRFGGDAARIAWFQLLRSGWRTVKPGA